MLLDQIIIGADKMLRNLLHKPVSKRAHPDEHIVDGEYTDYERKHIIGLMRVNHCGEVCAQGLYQGQALASRDQTNKKALEHAADEEIEHLAWTLKRIEELGGKTSLLNPLFYAGSLTLGFGVAVLGDKWSLGFLEETEKQVETHLTDHLDKLPLHDNKSRAIITQMREDEIKHAQMAHASGAAELPSLVRKLMSLSSKMMTKTTYHI